MTCALITGVTGQDGSYLAELLLKKGYRVIGATRNVEKAKLLLPVSLKEKIQLVEWKMNSKENIKAILSYYRPEEIYNYAAYSSGEGMFADAVGIGEINGIAVVRILEAILEVDKNIRFCQASSREIFGEAEVSPQTEATPICPRSPYGAAKAYADQMVKIFREHYGLFACSAILFNHESPRRTLSFVTRKITYEAARIKLGLSKFVSLGNLDALRDWGFAGDYVRCMWLMLQQTFPGDYIVATGKTHSVREFCECAFAHLNLDYRDFVTEDPAFFRPSEKVRLVGCSEKAKQLLRWEPHIGFIDLVKMMVDSDLVTIIKNRGEIKEVNDCA